MKRAPSSGFTLIDLLVLATLTGLLALLTVPPLLSWTAHARVEMAASELVGVLRQARAYAIRHSARVAVRFDPVGIDGRPTFALYRDGDGDGVRNDDIGRGIDPLVQAPRSLAHFGGDVGFGFPSGMRITDPGDPRRPLDRLDDPIRFNRSDLASFDPFGTATPGSLYVSDGRAVLYAVRVANRAGRVRILRYEPETGRWHPR
jgi:type II secretory pathway pseudopilin PulG